MKLLHLSLALLTATAVAEPVPDDDDPSATALPEPCENQETYIRCFGANAEINCDLGDSCREYCGACCDPEGTGFCPQ